MGEHKNPNRRPVEMYETFTFNAPKPLAKKMAEVRELTKVKDESGKESTPSMDECIQFWIGSFIKLFEAAREQEQRQKEESERMVWTPEQAAEASERLRALREQQKAQAFSGMIVGG